MKWTHGAIISAAVLLGPSLAGCSTQAKRVDCEGTLKPINRPASPSAPLVPSKIPQSSDEKASHEK